MSSLYRQRSYNRLFERRNNTTAMTFKMDERSRLIAEMILKFGYTNAGEMFIDLLYKEANRINPSLCLSVVSGLKEKNDELIRELVELQKFVQQQLRVI